MKQELDKLLCEVSKDDGEPQQEHAGNVYVLGI